MGEASWESTDYQGTGHLSGNLDTSAIPHSKMVSVTTLDKLTRELNIGDAHAFVKIDVEGFEPQVIEGGESFIRSFAPGMLIEISGMNAVGVGSDWIKATKILAETYQQGRYFGPLSQELQGVPPRVAIPKMLDDGRLHNALLS